MEFIAELHDIMESNVYPILFVRDFNLVRDSSKKSNWTVNTNWSFMFIDWINKWALLEIKASNTSFSLFNNQVIPVMGTLDRICVCTDW